MPQRITTICGASEQDVACRAGLFLFTDEIVRRINPQSSFDSGRIKRLHDRSRDNFSLVSHAADRRRAEA